MIRKIPYYGLIADMCYFVSILGLILIGNSTFLILLEICTVLSTPLLLLIFFAIPTSQEDDKEMAKKLSVIFMSCCMLLTSMAHFTNIAFIMPLQNSGVDIPTYFQLGQRPSVLMSMDYLGWGFFLGLAFIASSVATKKEYRLLKNTLLISGILCLIGLMGAVMISANCWYIAPCGYGIGSAFICIELIIIEKRKNENSCKGK